MKRTYYIVLLILSVVSAGCRLIDDDLSVCGTDVKLIYQTCLITNEEEELQSELSEAAMAPVAGAIRAFLTPIFQPDMHDLHLWFYDTEFIKETQIYTETVNAPTATLTHTLSEGIYSHICVANTDGNAEWNTSYDTVYSQTTGVYSARYTLTVTGSTPPAGTIPLYIAHSSIALVVDSSAISTDSIAVYVLGTAATFDAKDSVYNFRNKQVVTTRLIHPQCFETVCLPSKTEADASGAYYTLNVLVTLPDGKITKTALSVQTPLRPGDLKIIRCKVKDDGSVEPFKKVEVGAVVTLDWKKGSDFDVVTG